MKLVVNVNKSTCEDISEKEYPYMDTMKYLYWEEGILRNWKDYSLGYFVDLTSTDGETYCSKCGCDGMSNCEECNGYGYIDNKDFKCITCDGHGEISCVSCGGYSRTW